MRLQSWKGRGLRMATGASSKKEPPPWSKSAWASMIEDHAVGGLNNSIYLLTAWRLEVQGQSASKVSVSRDLAPWCVDGHLPTVSSHDCPSGCVCVLTSSSHEDTSHTGPRSIYMTSFCLHHLIKRPTSKTCGGSRR